MAKNVLHLRGIAHDDLGVVDDKTDMTLQTLIPPIVRKVLEIQGNLAILSCGTGVGVEVGANKFSGIRACLATTPQIATWSRAYDDCNVLCLVGWECSAQTIESVVGAWLDARYDGNEKRKIMFAAFDQWH